jgi:hypothetical protein
MAVRLNSCALRNRISMYSASCARCDDSRSPEESLVVSSGAVGESTQTFLHHERGTQGTSTELASRRSWPTAEGADRREIGVPGATAILMVAGAVQGGPRRLSFARAQAPVHGTQSARVGTNKSPKASTNDRCSPVLRNHCLLGVLAAQLQADAISSPYVVLTTGPSRKAHFLGDHDPACTVALADCTIAP